MLAQNFSTIRAPLGLVLLSRPASNVWHWDQSQTTCYSIIYACTKFQHDLSTCSKGCIYATFIRKAKYGCFNILSVCTWQYLLEKSGLTIVGCLVLYLDMQASLDAETTCKRLVVLSSMCVPNFNTIWAPLGLVVLSRPASYVWHWDQMHTMRKALIYVCTKFQHDPSTFSYRLHKSNLSWDMR